MIQDAICPPPRPLCRYLIRPDPLSLVPNQGSNRKCNAGLSESHRFDTQDSTHLWETEKKNETSIKKKKKDRNTVKPLPEKGGNTGRNRNQDLVGWSGKQPGGTWPSHFLHIQSSWTQRCRTCMDLFYNDGNVLFMHLPIFKAEICGHRSAFNEKLYVFISVYVHVTASCTLQRVCACVPVRTSVYVCYWNKSETLPTQPGQPKESAAKWKSRGVFLCPSLCCRCVSSHLMLFDISESDATVQTPCEVFLSFFFFFLFYLHKAFWELSNCLLHPQLHPFDLFYAHQQRRNPKSIDGHKSDSEHTWSLQGIFFLKHSPSLCCCQSVTSHQLAFADMHVRATGNGTK